MGFSRLEVPEQALDEISLGLGSVMKIHLLNFHVLYSVYFASSCTLYSTRIKDPLYKKEHCMS